MCSFNDQVVPDIHNHQLINQCESNKTKNTQILLENSSIAIAQRMLSIKLVQ